MRCVTHYDAEAVAELEILLFPENCLNETTLAGEIKLGMGLAIEHEGTLLAYALLRDDGHLLDLLRLGVHPSHQRQGLGTQLLEHIFKMNREVMLTVRPNNQAALRLYLALGFVIVGQLQGGVGWVMTRPAAMAYALRLGAL